MKQLKDNSTEMQDRWKDTEVWVEWCNLPICWLTLTAEHVCLHVRRNREQQAYRRGDMRCLRWAVENWKKVTGYCSHLFTQYLRRLLFWLQGVKRDKPVWVWKLVDLKPFSFLFVKWPTHAAHLKAHYWTVTQLTWVYNPIFVFIEIQMVCMCRKWLITTSPTISRYSVK